MKFVKTQTMTIIRVRDDKILLTADLIVGIQWGDEGKGKIVDMLSTKV